MKSITKPAIALAIVCLFLISGCTSVGYYAQSMSGQMHIIFKKKAISRLIEDPNTDQTLRQKLMDVRQILTFAQQTLLLPDNGSYRHYSDLNRKYVVWNVVAAPEFSLTPKQWCYPIVGCMNYRGYFSEEDAIHYANSLRDDGWEVYIGGVSAYSTLGWFKDPLINTMLNREDWEIARLIFHELAHQLIYIKDDTDFNEAFAESVSLIGLQSWMQAQPLTRQHEIMEFIRHDAEFTRLALETRNSLQKVYGIDAPDSEIRRHKAGVIAGMKDGLRQLQGGWSNDNRYQGWINNPVDNARLSLISTYRTLVPQFMAIYDDSGSNLQKFYFEIRKIADCQPRQRMARLMRQGAGTGTCGESTSATTY